MHGAQTKRQQTSITQSLFFANNGRLSEENGEKKETHKHANNAHVVCFAVLPSPFDKLLPAFIVPGAAADTLACCTQCTAELAYLWCNVERAAHQVLQDILLSVKGTQSKINGFQGAFAGILPAH